MIITTALAATLLTSSAVGQTGGFPELIPVAAQPSVVGPIGPFVTTRIYLDDVELEGITIEGLELEREYIDYREGNTELPTRNTHGIPKYTNLTMKRGRPASDDFLRTWTKSFHLPDPDQRVSLLSTKELQIDLVVGEGRVLERIKMKNCWPRRYVPFVKLPPEEGQPITESVTLSCEEATSDDGPFFVPGREIRRRDR
ncbi:MAG: phage tail protein [Pseudomonadota bacterium]